jgi:pilus assembly protein CpaB
VKLKFAINRSVVLLVAALVLGGLSAFGVKRFIERQMEEVEARGKNQRMVRVLVPKEDLPKGAPLTEQAVALREMPAEWAHSNAISPEQFARVENQKLAYPAARGEMILWSMLEGQAAPSFSARLLKGRRAITVPVDEVNSISGMLQPGDRIDLMVSTRKDTRTFMFPLLQNVVVLATGSQAVAGSEAEGNDGRRSYTTITLDAAPQDAQRLLAAREIGKLAALLRSPGDTAAAFSSNRDAMSLLGLDEPQRVAGKDTSVPVIYGGGTGDAMKELPRLAAAAPPAAPATPVARPPAEPAAPSRPALDMAAAR